MALQNCTNQLMFFLTLLLFSSPMNAQTIVDFTETKNTKNWQVVDDGVMGGRSSGSFMLTNENYAQFSGSVSLENNGGFSSVRHDMETLKVNPKSKLLLKLKGDGNPYQFRVKHNRKEYYSYTIQFETTGDWQTVEIELAELYPSFRGRQLDLPNFNHTTLEELRFLIGNKKQQEFQLLLKSITVVD